jgi:hypothetical protein
MSLSISVQTIINKNYNISDLESFAKEYCNEYNYKEESILINFQFIESMDLYPVSIDYMHNIKPKVNIKSLEKSLNLKSKDYMTKEDKEYFSYTFYKKFISFVDIEEFEHLDRLEKIYTIDMIKRNSHPIKTKPKNIYTGYIVSYYENIDNEKLIIIEFLKHKQSNVSEMSELIKDKKVFRKFTFDFDLDKVKPFNEDVKKIFHDKLENIDDKENIKLNKKRLEISEMTHIPKEERNSMEKELKFVKTTAKSMKISIKSTKICFLEHEEFNIDDILNKIDISLSAFSSIVQISLKEDVIDEEIKKEEVVDEEIKKEEVNNEEDTDNEEGNEDNFMDF